MKKLLLILCIFSLLSTAAAQQPPHPPITAENAHQLTVTETLGRGRITDAGWTADGQTLVVAAATGLWLYDANDLTAEPRFLPSEHGWIRSMAIHPSEGIVATGFEDGFIQLWYLDDRELDFDTPQVLHGHEQPVISLAFDQSGRGLVSGSVNEITAPQGLAQIWDIGWGGIISRTLTLNFQDTWTSLEQVVISSDGSQVAIGGRVYTPDETYTGILVYKVADGTLLHAEHLAYRAAFLPDNSLIYACQPMPFLEDDLCFNDVAFARDNSLMAIIEGNYHRTETEINNLWIVDTATQELLWQNNLVDLPVSVAFHPFEQKIVMVDANQGISIWDINSHMLAAHLSSFQESPYLQNQRGVSVDNQPERCIIHVADETDNYQFTVLAREQRPVLYNCYGVEAALHATQPFLLINRSALHVEQGIETGNMTLWNYQTGEMIKVWKDFTGLNIQFTPDGYIAHSIEHTINILDYNTQEIAESYEGGEFTYAGETFDNLKVSVAWIAASTGGTFPGSGQLYIWDRASGEMVYNRSPRYSGINDLAFNPAGDLLAYAANDGKITMMTIPEYEVVATLDSLYGTPLRLSFDETGSTLSASYSSGVILLLQVATPQS